MSCVKGVVGKRELVTIANAETHPMRPTEIALCGSDCGAGVVKTNNGGAGLFSEISAQIPRATAQV